MKKKILIIEDDDDVRTNINELLGEEGFEVITAENGLIGIAQIKEHLPDLVICDIAMPVFDGLELLKRVRTHMTGYDRPFIFLSAKATRDDVRTGMNNGADDYITKPFTRKDILDAVYARLHKNETIDAKNSKLRVNIVQSLPQELLTPLNAIYMGGSLLKNADNNFSLNEVNELGDIIYTSAASMKDVFSKYLCLLEIFINAADPFMAQNLKNEICYLPDDIIKMVASDVSELHKRKPNLRTKIDRCTINIADNHLFRIAHEIIDNAFKFSEPDSIVTVLGGVSFNYYLLSVHNTGSSMSEDQISLIGEFIKFRKNNQLGGLGLGLTIAKNYCHNYNADFSIASTNNSVTVNCRFPIKK